MNREIQQKIEDLEDDLKIKMEFLKNEYNKVEILEKEVSKECDETYERIMYLKQNKGFVYISNDQLSRILERYSDETKESCNRARCFINESIENMERYYASKIKEIEESVFQ